MNYDVLRQFGLQDLVPADHLLSVFLKDLQQARVEVSLQGVVVLDPFLLHEILDRGIAVPLLAFVFVAADMQVLVREERGHLAEKSVEKLVDLFARRIESGLEDSRTAFDRVWTRRAAELRVADKPARAVAGYVKLRHHANAAVARVGD